LSAIL